jgi:hypothetical protein
MAPDRDFDDRADLVVLIPERAEMRGRVEIAGGLETEAADLSDAPAHFPPQDDANALAGAIADLDRQSKDAANLPILPDPFAGCGENDAPLTVIAIGNARNDEERLVDPGRLGLGEVPLELERVAAKVDPGFASQPAMQRIGAGEPIHSVRNRL